MHTRLHPETLALGWTFNPSEWRHRAPAFVLSLASFLIAAYLGLYQIGFIPTVWEPFFGDDSHWILKDSSISHLLPVPDALIGAFFYLLDAIVVCFGGGVRWRSRPSIVLLQGLLAAGLAAGGVVLAAVQPVVLHACCTLCLTVAACSILIVGFVTPEVLATLQFLKSERRHGISLRSVLTEPQAAHETGGAIGPPRGRGHSI